MKLPEAFYRNPDVVLIARQLLGKIVVTRLGNRTTSGRIVETEAYAGITDRASHSFGGKFTERTRIMYESGGVAYVYLCYGIHHLFNVVTHREGIPHAVLIRAVEPIEGIDLMLKRRAKNKIDFALTSGPGSLSAALGIQTKHSGLTLQSDRIWIEDDGTSILPSEILTSSRVGVAYAKEDALLPYRFRIAGNPWCSKAK